MSPLQPPWNLSGRLGMVVGLLAMFLPLVAGAAGTNWMSAVNGRLSLAALNIPGTHDSGALHEPLTGTSRCQHLTLAQQLDAGVRFLDIRCRHINDTFLIYHGSVDQRLRFDDVLDTVLRFLTNQPTETVILSVKEESTPANNTRSFEATFDAYVARQPERWLLGDAIPMLDAARGKIVLFRRFGAGSTPKGINASRWPDNTTFTAGRLRVQDVYRVTRPDAKWTAITNLLEEARVGDRDTLHVNFTSGVRNTFIIPDILSVANDINPRLTSFLTANTNGRFGIIVMDFAEPARCALIYGTTAPGASKP